MTKTSTLFSLIIITVVSISLLTSCTVKGPSTVAKEFLMAISFGDYEKAKELASDGSQSALESLSAFNDGQEFEFEITNEDINGEYARVYYIVDGNGEEQHLRLRKDSKRGWVVIFSKGDLPQTKVEIDSMDDLGRGLGKVFGGLGSVVDTLGKTMGKVAKEINENGDEWAKELEREMKKKENEWEDFEREIEKNK